MFMISLSSPEDKADPGPSDISATRCPKVPGHVLVHTSIAPSPDNLYRFALEHEASEQVEIYLWKLVKGEHWPPPSWAYLWPVTLTRHLRSILWIKGPPAQEDPPLATLLDLSLQFQERERDRDWYMCCRSEHKRETEIGPGIL